MFLLIWRIAAQWKSMNLLFIVCTVVLHTALEAGMWKTWLKLLFLHRRETQVPAWGRYTVRCSGHILGIVFFWTEQLLERFPLHSPSFPKRSWGCWFTYSFALHPCILPHWLRLLGRTELVNYTAVWQSRCLLELLVYFIIIRTKCAKHSVEKSSPAADVVQLELCSLNTLGKQWWELNGNNGLPSTIPSSEAQINSAGSQIS